MSRDIILAFRHGVLLQGPNSVERERAREDVSNDCSDVNVMEPSGIPYRRVVVGE